MDMSMAQRADWCAHLAKALFKQHHAEDESYLRGLIPEDAAVFDVGAHSGQYTKLFAKLARPGRVFAFEPGAYALTILKKVVRLHQLENVQLMPVALSDKEEDVAFNVPLKRGKLGFGIAHLGKAREDYPAVTSIVHATTVDKVADKLGLTRLDFIKADIEGWELHMLRGAKRSLERFRPALQLEISEARLKGAGENPAAVFNFLALAGYLGERLANGDFLFVPVRG
jgi:FkbM family methyltransferase